MTAAEIVASSAPTPSPLRDRAFRLLLGGQVLSNAGDQLYLVAIPILLLAKGGGPRGLGVVLAIFGVTRALALSPGGWLADRLGPRRVMLGADLGRCLVVAGLALLALHPRPSLWAFAAVAGVLGIGDGLFNPASFAIVPALLPDDLLQSANAIFQASIQAVGVAAPAAAGFVVAAFRPSTALAADAGTFAVSAASLALVGRLASRGRGSPRDGPGHEADEPGPGTTGDRTAPTLWATWKASPLLRVIFLAAAAASLVFGGALEVGMPALARGPLEAGAQGYGALLAGFSLGGLSGALLSSWIGRRRTGPVAVGALSLLGLALVGMAGTPYLPAGARLVAAVVLAVLGGVGLGLGNTLLLTLVQRRLPIEAMGRVMGAMLLANFGLYPISTVVAGSVIGQWGVATYLLGAGIVATVAVLATLGTHSMRTSTLTSRGGVAPSGR
ncbi:MAG: MFS transporter [Acidimicrobiales bacterium]